MLIVGGGISGAPLYRQLCRLGYRTAIIDKGDFASGTSQASGMLVWGGLLYLKELDLMTVIQLCRARNELMRGFPEQISVLNLRYWSSSGGNGRNPATVLLGLYAYWMLGGFALGRPSTKREAGASSLGYQEGMLRESDSRFVIDLIGSFHSEHCIALNYCRLIAAEFVRERGCWSVLLRDERTGTDYPAQARLIVNAAGVWTDQVNQLLQVESPFKHVFSKGVYLAFPRRTEQTEAEVYPMQTEDDVLTHVPWGPVMMWGPTETAVLDLESGLAPNREDIRFLLTNANRLLPEKVGAEDVVSVRCGIRPLAVPKNYSRDVYPLELSRRHQIVVNREKCALSLYGGKFTSSLRVASQTAKLIGRTMRPRFPKPGEFIPPAERTIHGRLGANFVTAEWARDKEYCLTLDDYLRRRTPLAQWIPRMGLDRDGSGREELKKMAGAFAPGPVEAEAMVEEYEQKVRRIYDPLLSV